jgi:hypothetical protein
MYLVELRPGKEELYRSSDELALAIRNGDVDARSRVYHRATAKWISITLHPQYKAIVAAAKEEPAARPLRRVWGMLGGGSGEQSSVPPESAGPTNGGQLQYRWRRPLALGVSTILLMSGLQLAFSGPRPPWAARGRTAVVTPRNTEAPPRSTEAETLDDSDRSSGLVSLASSRAVWEEPTPVLDTVESAPEQKVTAPSLPRAPRIRSLSLADALAPGATGTAGGSSLEGVMARYAAAHDAAQSRLESGLRVARLTRLFAASRLGPDGGVTDTRMSLAGAANFIRVFRQQQTAIERAYQDTVTALAKQQSWSPKKVRQWYSRSSRKEAPALEQLSGSLVASIDSVLAILTGQAGAYKIRGSAIAFEDPSAGQTYARLRRKIKEQINAAVVAGGATSSGATALLLQAIGTTSLPRET